MKEKSKVVESTQRKCQILEEVAQKGNFHMVVCGDFNYPEIDWENEHVNEASPVIYPFIETIQGCFLHQHIFEPTRYRENQEPSLLDLVFTNEEGMLQELVHRTGLGDSDHECLTFHLKCYNLETKTAAVPNFLKGDYVTIRNRLLRDAMKGCIPNRVSPKKRKGIYMMNEASRKKDLKNFGEDTSELNRLLAIC